MNMHKAAVVGVVFVLALAGFTYRSFGNERQMLKATLTGFQEVPSISSTGHGEIILRLDDASLEYELNYADLEGTPTLFAHVHIGQRGVNGGVMFFLCGGPAAAPGSPATTRPPCTNPAGTFTGTVTANDIIGPSGQGISPGEFEEVLRAIRSGNAYANVHTQKHPGGELRGQLRTDNETNPH